MNEKLEFLLRKNKGKGKFEGFKSVFTKSGFRESELTHIELDSSDKIIEQLKNKLQYIKKETELLNSDSLFIDSDLMRGVYLSLREDTKCYIFTDDYLYCGMFNVNTKRGMENIFRIAKNDLQNTCFLLDANLQFYFTINYNDENESDYPLTFDIQLTRISPN